MKVLMSTDNIGGVWTYTINLARGLKENGIDVFIAVVGNALNDNQREMLDTYDHEVIFSRQEWMQDPWIDLERAGKRLLNLADNIEPDIVHLNSYSFGSLPWDRPVIMTAHSCVLSWWEAVLNEAAPPEWDEYAYRAGQGIRSVGVVVAPSFTMLAALKKFYHPRRTEVIYNGADPSEFYEKPREDFVFSMGRLWDKAKNTGLVIEAARMIDYPVYLAGNFDHAKLPELPPNVKLTGYLSRKETAGYLSRAAIYLLPVLYEPFGYSFLEAAFSGCPIITGDIGSMREIWGDTAILTDPRDAGKLARQVNSLMEDRSLRSSMAESARSKALSNYTLDKMTSGYISLYNKVLKSVPAGA